MIIERQDFELFGGDTKVLMVNIVDEDTGEPVDLTEIKGIIWQVKRAPGARLSLIEKNLDDGIELVDIINGEFKIFLDEEDTINLGGTYYHECDIINAVGSRATVLYGYVTIR